MSVPIDAEWRFDRVDPAHQWACCVWEYGREYMAQKPRTGRYRQRAATIGRLRGIGKMCGPVEFPASPWLTISDELKAECAETWCVTLGDLENYEPLRSFRGPADALTAAQWQTWLRKEGVVVFELGVPPRLAQPLSSDPEPKREDFERFGQRAREQTAAAGGTLRQQNDAANAAAERVFRGHHKQWKWRKVLRYDPNAEGEIGAGVRPTRAQLLARFEAWLDANPEWWDGAGRRGSGFGIAGKNKPVDGLRWLAWTRLRRTCKSDGEVERIVRETGVQQWMGTFSAERARKLPDEAAAWLKRICEA